jgi:hypothetical protein
MIDLETEELITKNQARRLPWMKGRFGNAVSLCTLERWCGPGIGGIVLETVRVGGTVFTSHAATLRFIERLNQQHPTSGAPRPTAKRQSEIDGVDRRLDEAGI